MWWSSRSVSLPGPAASGRRRLLSALPLGAGLVAVAGCGFRPLYGGREGEAVAEELAAIEVHAPLTRLGRILQNQLTDDLDPAGLALLKRYRLDLRLRQNSRALAIQLDDTVTRFDLSLAAFFTLRPAGSGGSAQSAPAHEVERTADPRLPLPDRAELEAEAARAADVERDGADAERDSTAPDPDAAESDPDDEAEHPDTLYRSAVRRVASYNVIREPFATLIAEQDAERRAAVAVSREIRTLLTLFFENRAA